MALGKSHSISTFVTKFLWILFLVFQESNLVICGGSGDDSLKKALETIERRQRDLEFQENEYYGQPENIGYGFQKTLGFFDNAGPATELGSLDSGRQSDADLQNLLLDYGGYSKAEGDYDSGFDKRKSSFRERMSNPRKTYLSEQSDDGEDYTQGGMEYLQLLKNLWAKYQRSRPEDGVSLEDLTDEQVEEILNSLHEKGSPEERLGKGPDYGETNGYEPFEMMPVRLRKSYRVFDRFGDRKKRYPSFGEGIYGKRNLHSQNINFEGPSENDFLYSLKFVNPDLNREAVENLREEGFEVLGDEKDKDVINILNDAMNRPKYVEEDEPYWSRSRNNYEEEETWLPGPATLDDGYGDPGRNEKRRELLPRHFKTHEGVRLNAKRFPVKRSSVRVRKEAKNEKVSKELKGIFATQEAITTAVPIKKTATKKPMEVAKKQNATKPEVTKHHESKKVVRRADKYTREEVLPARGNEEIADIFSVDKKSKKSIDWSKHFGLDKRSGESWLNAEYLKAEADHLAGSKSKRYSFDRVSGQGYEMPFDTRKFSKKRYSYDLGANIDRVENRIGDIEEKIIDDAVKFTGAHTGGDKAELSQVKSRVIQRLEAAYSLEKMKNALEEFKNFIKPGRNVEPLKKPTETPSTEARTTVSVPKEGPNLEQPLSDKKPVGEASKRVATKKEGVKSIFSQEPADGLDFLNDVYGGKQYDSDDCPVLDRILHNCLRVEEMGGRFAELLVPLCSLQQICYFCGAETGLSRMSTCDAMYLTEAQNICQGDSDCLVNARNSMLALQDLYEQDVMSESGRRLLGGSCLANPCIQRYFLDAPGAIYPLEIQK